MWGTRSGGAWAACLAALLCIELGRADIVSRWALDGDLDDTGDAYDNFGIFQGGAEPNYVAGVDGLDDGAIELDGVDDLIEIAYDGGLPIHLQDAYSVTLWVRGFPQADRRVFSESSRFDRDPLFNIGTQNAGANGAVDIYIRDENGVQIVNHLHSTREAFDGQWHHIAWVDDDGRAVLYIDGVRDATDFTYAKRPIAIETTSIGGILRDTPSHWFAGAIDDVRVFDHALAREEVREIIRELYADCPAEGDTHLGGISVEGPAGGGPGPYTIIAEGATDDSGDEIRYIFTATNERGDVLHVGPQAEEFASFQLFAGTWTIVVEVDDELLCFDEAPDASGTVRIEIGEEPRVLVAHLRFDGTLEDEGDIGYDVEFLGSELEASFEEGHCEDGRDLSISFDGIDDMVRIHHDDGLPIHAHRAFSVALWVRGDYLVQTAGDRRVFSEASTLNNNPLFTIGTDNTGTSPSVDIYIRTDTGGILVPHIHSIGAAFDGEWHHIAWVDDYGDGALYIDGERDPANFRYARGQLTLDTTSVGGILRAAPSHWFTGLIDDVRLYNYALAEDEILEIIDDCGIAPPVGLFRRGDVTADGNLTIGDAIFFLNHLFAGGPAPPCPDAGDMDDNGSYTIGDAVYLLNYLFAGGPAPLPPGPDACGPDPSPDPWPAERCVFPPCR